MPRCTVCHEPVFEPGMAEITERPISRLLRDGSIIRDMTTSVRIWCRTCTPEE